MARQLVQATLPHRNPGDDVHVWTRTNGNLTLSVQPGIEKGKSLGLPYGSIPRLLLFWITTEAIRTQNRRLDLGNTLTDFLEQLDLNRTGGKRGDITRLRRQMKRLFMSRISFEYTDDHADRWLSMEVAPEGELWWDYRDPQKGSLFDSWIELGEKFFKAVTAAPVPIDVRALKALKQSPLALDLYAWATYTTYGVSKSGKPRSVSWELLHKQFGGDYNEIKEFNRKARAAFTKIQTVYPELRIEFVRGGLAVQPGRTAVLAKPPTDKATREQRVFPKSISKPTKEASSHIVSASVETCVSGHALEQARQLAKNARTGWAIDALEREFYVYARKKGEALKNPDAAFTGFVKHKIKKAP